MSKENIEIPHSVRIEAEELSNEGFKLLPEIRHNIETSSYNEHSVLFGFGGKNLHRGWHCPSIVLDIVVGNCSRGRLVSHPRSSKYDYKYYFDSKGYLTVVDSFFQGKLTEKEYIFYEDNIVRGYTFLCHNQTLVRYSKEVYDNDICSSYSTVYYATSQNCPSLYYHETNTVIADKMKSVITNSCLDINSCDIWYCLFDLDSSLTLMSYDYSENNHFPSGSPKRDVFRYLRKINSLYFRKETEQQ